MRTRPRSTNAITGRGNAVRFRRGASRKRSLLPVLPLLLLIAAAVIPALQFFPGAIRPDGEPVTGRASIIDGDTITIGTTRVRLNGIDAPESGQTCRNATGNTWRCGAKAANALSDYGQNIPADGMRQISSMQSPAGWVCDRAHSKFHGSFAETGVRQRRYQMQPRASLFNGSSADRVIAISRATSTGTAYASIMCRASAIMTKHGSRGLGESVGSAARQKRAKPAGERQDGSGMTMPVCGRQAGQDGAGAGTEARHADMPVTTSNDTNYCGGGIR